MKFNSMGIVNEPEGVDFVIKSDPLTEEEAKKLSEYIANWKKKNKKSEDKSTKYSEPD